MLEYPISLTFCETEIHEYYNHLYDLKSLHILTSGQIKKKCVSDNGSENFR